MHCKRQDEEIANKHQSLVVHRIILASAVLVILLIAYLLWRSYKYNKVLTEKNHKLYEEIEQRRQEQQQEMEQLQAAPEEQLTAEQQLFRRLCTLMDEQKQVCSVAKFTEKNMLAAPCDQRYSTDDMKTIGAEIVRVIADVNR